MADSSPTSSNLRQTFTSRLPLITWVAIALVFLVAITISAGSDSSTPDEAASVGASVDGSASADADDSGSGSGQTGSEESDVSASDGEAAPAGEPADSDSPAGSPASGSTVNDPGDGETENEPTTTDPGDESASTPSTTVGGTPSVTTLAGATPATTAVPGVAPPTTTIAVEAPTTTIVITAPTTTIVVAAPPTTTIPPRAVTEGCSVLDIDEFGDLEIEVTAVSPTTAVAQLEVGFELRDVDGEVFLPDFLLVEFVAPGEVMRIGVLTFEPVPEGNDVSSITCEISGVEVIDLFEDQELPGPQDTCSVIGVDEIGDIQLDVTVRNPDIEPADLIFTYALRDQQGVRVISDVGFADGLDPGQVSTQQIDTLLPPPAGVDPATLTCEIVGHELF